MNLGKLIYDSAMNNVPMEYANCSVKEREDAIREKLFEVLGVEGYEVNSFRKAMRRNKIAVFEIIEEVIDNILAHGDYKNNTFYNHFVEVKNIALGDANEFYIEGGNILEVAEFSGSHWDLKRQRLDIGESLRVAMRDYGIKVYEYAERIATGRVDFGKVVAEIAKAVERKMGELAEATFAMAMEAVPSEFKVAGASDAEEILEVCQHVEVANGEAPILIGTKLAIRKLQGVVDVASDKMLDAKNEHGMMAVWQGIPCMEIAQGHKVGTFEFTMPNDKVYIVAGNAKPVKMVLEGHTEVKEVSEELTADGAVENIVRFKAGCAVVYGGVIGEITLA